MSARDGDASEFLSVDELDVEGMLGNLFFRLGAAMMAARTTDDARHAELAQKLYELAPFCRALGAVARAHVGETRAAWAEALGEPMPFGGAPLGMPRRVPR